MKMTLAHDFPKKMNGDDFPTATGISANFGCGGNTNYGTKDFKCSKTRPTVEFSLLPTNDSTFSRRLDRLRLQNCKASLPNDENKFDSDVIRSIPYASVSEEFIRIDKSNTDCKNHAVFTTINDSKRTILEGKSEGCKPFKSDQEHNIFPRIPATLLMESIAPYIADRASWNSLAAVNTETLAISRNARDLYRPWPSVRWRATVTIRRPSVSPMRRRVARGSVPTSARPWSVCFGRDYLSYGTDQGDVLVRAVNGNGSVKMLEGKCAGRINCLKTHGDWIVSGGEDSIAHIWNIRNLSCEGFLLGHEASITSISILPIVEEGYGSKTTLSRFLVATASLDCTVHFHLVTIMKDQLVSTKHVATLVDELQPKPIYSIDLYKRNGKVNLLSGGLDGCLRLWKIEYTCVVGDYDNGNLSIPFPMKIQQNICVYRCEGEIKCIAIAEDNMQIAIGFGRTICHGSLADLHLLDNQMRDQEKQKMWCRRSQEEAHKPKDTNWKLLRGHYSGDIRCLKFLPDGDSLASACSEGSIRIWDLKKGRWKRKWKAHNGFLVCSIDVSREGRSLLSAGSDGTVAIKSIHC